MNKSGNSDNITQFKDLKQITQKEIRRAYWKYIVHIVSTESELEPGSRGNNMKRFWTFIKRKRSDGSKIPKGLLHPDSQEKSDILNHQFQKAFSEKITYSDEKFQHHNNMRNRQPPINDIHITIPSQKLLKNLNPDNITPRVLNELATTIEPILATVFQVSYTTGTCNVEDGQHHSVLYIRKEKSLIRSTTDPSH